MSLKKLLFGVFLAGSTMANAQKKPELFVLSVGVEHYQDATLNLHYAADDAKDIGAMFRKQTTLWNVKEVKVLTDEKAKGNDIINAIKGFRKKVTADDYFVLLFSGHGIEGRLVPYDYDGNLYRTTISKEEIWANLNDLGCGYMVFIDACHSASFAKDLPGKNIEVSTQQSQVDKATKELIEALSGTDKPYLVFGSSATNQKSWECKSCGHGYFAQAILWAFENKEVKEGPQAYRPDADNDGFLSVSELDNYLKEAVRVMTKTEQSPQKVYSRLTMGKEFNLTTWLKNDPPNKKKDTDKDGIPDEQDNCPTIKGAVKFNGCPTDENAASPEDIALKIRSLCASMNKKYHLGCGYIANYLDCYAGFLAPAEFKSMPVSSNVQEGKSVHTGLDLYRTILNEYKVDSESDVLALIKITKNGYLIITEAGVYWPVAVKLKLQWVDRIEFVPFSALEGYKLVADGLYLNIKSRSSGKLIKQLTIRLPDESRGVGSRELKEFLEGL